MKYAECDICGARDSWSVEPQRPFLRGGAVLRLRELDDEKTGREMEFCPECRGKLALFIERERVDKSPEKPRLKPDLPVFHLINDRCPECGHSVGTHAAECPSAERKHP